MTPHLFGSDIILFSCSGKKDYIIIICVRDKKPSCV